MSGTTSAFGKESVYLKKRPKDGIPERIFVRQDLEARHEQHVELQLSSFEK